MAPPDYPSVSAEKLDGWELADEAVETVFKLPAARVVGATRQYEDEQTRAAVREATDGEIDHKWRFFAATRLGFEPMLPPGTLPSMILPTMQTEARKKFEQRLESRGVEDVQRARTERVRVRSGNRARLTRYDGRDPVVDGGVPVTGWVGVWNDGTDFFVVTGGYPGVPLADGLGIENGDPLRRTPNEAQTELMDLLRDVS
jgi:hypothetical protein